MSNRSFPGNYDVPGLDPFIILYDYRRAVKRKKMRQLRRSKIQRQRQVLQLQAENRRKMRTNFLNRSMFEQQNVWKQIQSDQSEVSIDVPAYSQQKIHEGQIKRVCLQVLYSVPFVQKVLLYKDRFDPFNYKFAEDNK